MILEVDFQRERDAIVISGVFDRPMAEERNPQPCCEIGVI
jgi:hypothetical protein